MKTSTIKTTPHNLAAIISKIKGNNEVSGGSAVSTGSNNVATLKKPQNLRSKRMERVSLQLQQQAADAKGAQGTSNLFFSNNAFSGQQATH